MRRYEQYAPSGFEWLGDLPSHWSILRAKYVFREVDDRSVSGDEELLSVSHLTGVTPRSEKNVTMFMAEDYTGAKLCKDGDLVINTMWAWMGALGVSSTTGIVSPAYGVYRQLEQRLRPRYMDWLFRTPMYVAEYTRRSTGVNSSRLRLYPDRFLDMPVVMPSLEDQDRIIAFLDQKTTEVDAAIAKKERLIELLAEQRGIQINQAVTRGLQPNVALRDSGVEWLGVIPQHWESVPLKHVSAVQSGLTLGKNYAQLRGAKRYPYLRVANVQDGYIDLSEVTEITMPVREAKNYLLRTGDILVTEGGDIDKLGRGNCWYGELEECLHQNHVFAVRVLCKVRPEFVSLITGVPYARRYFTTTANKTTNLASTNKTKLGNLPLLVPPLQEQDAILAHCHDVKVGFAELVAGVNKEIAALKEMKNVLIAETISGKIKI
ncbi:type I restriction enzyme S subunit [Aquabacterium commune]|jgi:type I restriction enzyme S subunit|uniref:Type I restriction enzyme S subunit n=1 Tax=Aquabacterium commune TaxID=70586 RepID=A0A4R6R114_9BURK|nr:type I restriction enzyme S subunit [Aquabacterium commune]